MRILITGGTGAIGRRLVHYLIQQGHVVTVVSRQPFKPATLPAKINFAQWDGKTAAGWGYLVEEVEAVVNLAGAGLADSRWTEERKKELVASRVNAGKAVAEALGAASNKPRVLIQASAVGYYGTLKDEIATEADEAGSGFLADLCKKWEASSQPVEGMGVRRVIIRSGVVLDMQGKVLPKMVMPFRFFVGGPVGSGRQWVSWIHYLDEVAAILFLIEQESVSGAINLTAPDPLQNRALAKIIGKSIKRPAFVPTPGFVLKFAFGEMSTVILDGQRIAPARLQELGYEFKYPTAEEALRDLLGP